MIFCGGWAPPPALGDHGWMYILCLQYWWANKMFCSRNSTMKLMEGSLHEPILRVQTAVNPANLSWCFFLQLQYKKRCSCPYVSSGFFGRLSNDTEAAVCHRCSGLNNSTADITVHLFFIANICLACYIVTMICISSPDSMKKKKKQLTNTRKGD